MFRRPAATATAIPSPLGPHRHPGRHPPRFVFGFAATIIAGSLPYAAALHVRLGDGELALPGVDVVLSDGNASAGHLGFLGDGFMPTLPTFCSQNDDCSDNKVCMPRTLFGTISKCVECRSNRDCASRVDQPPAGEVGKMYCNRDENTCEAPKGLIGAGGYPVWLPSETIDNSKTFQRYQMPRSVISDDPEDPPMETAWYYDFKEQDSDAFNIDRIIYNGTHITIPGYSKMHAGYSKTYKAFDEEETGIVTNFFADNQYSIVADFPKVSFVEKYHALTFKGKKDLDRGEYMKDLSAKQVEAEPEFDMGAWLARAVTKTQVMSKEQTMTSQVQSGVDAALSWQIRRFVNTYNGGSAITPENSPRWASHSAKAKEAIKLAKDKSFEREYLKSEQHCKHLETIDGLDVDDDDNVIIPLGRPIATFSGEMVLAPTHYLGFAQGILTAHYNETEKIFQLFLQGYGNSRQWHDVKFPGRHDQGLFLGRVSEGEDYAINPDKDGRGDSLYRKDQPTGPWTDRFYPDTPDVTIWRRTLEERCSMFLLGDSLDKVDVNPDKDSIFDGFVGTGHFLKGVVAGLPCSTTWMDSDYGVGSHSMDSGEIGLWGHSLGEIRDDWTAKMVLAEFWNEWECFYQGAPKEDCWSR